MKLNNNSNRSIINYTVVVSTVTRTLCKKVDRISERQLIHKINEALSKATAAAGRTAAVASISSQFNMSTPANEPLQLTDRSPMLLEQQQMAFATYRLFCHGELLHVAVLIRTRHQMSSVSESSLQSSLNARSRPLIELSTGTTSDASILPVGYSDGGRQRGGVRLSLDPSVNRAC